MPVRPLHALAEARGHLFPFVPVFMGIGIGLWFLPAREPSWDYVAALVVFGLAALVTRWSEAWNPLAIAAACIAAGFLLAGLRAEVQDAPILGFRYYGAVEGRVIEIDRSSSDRLRITLDRVVLERTDPARMPEKVRVSLHGDQRFFVPEPGATVILTAHLSAPMPPAAPDAFDFRRMAYFDRLGAIGYTNTPVLTLAAPEAGTQIINRLRGWLSAAIQNRIEGQAGAFASGSVTGDRSGITQATVEDLRDSNLSHLLAISGMNLAFLVGFVFAVTRYGLALVPWVALRVNTKKVAAVVSLAVAAFYLALSGGNVATERAFVMVVISLGAILCDRRALSMRTVALSGVVLLALQPEALMHPGFQMSMAATVMLIWGFSLIDRQTYLGRMPRWTLPVYTAVLSSVLGGLATGPIAAAHFNRFTDYGLLANLLTVPAMGLCIMPGAVIAALLAPIGLPHPGLWLMEAGAVWILTVARWIAGWEGAVTGIPAPAPFVLALLVLGAIWAIVWRGRARWAGVPLMVAAFAIWALNERPFVLVSADAALVGVAGPEGRALSFPRGAGFAAGVWLEDDGDLATQEAAALRAGFADGDGMRLADAGAFRAAHLKGKGAAARVPAACAAADVVVLAAEWADPRPEGCLLLDRTVLEQTGALAIAADGRITRTLSTARRWDLPVKAVPVPERVQ